MFIKYKNRFLCANIYFILNLIILFFIGSSYCSANQIENLKKELSKGFNQETVDSFWKKIEESGAPIVENVKGLKDQVRVTFILKENSFVKHVSLVCEDADPWKLGLPMENIKNTNIWYTSLLFPKNSMIMYGFVRGLDIPHEDEDLSHDKEKLQEVDYFLKQIQKDPLNPTVGVSDLKDRSDFFNLHFKSHTTSFGVSEKKLSVLDLSKKVNRSWIIPRDIPHGILDEFEFPKSVVKKNLPNSRKIAIYLPPQFNDKRKERYPVVILFDGDDYFHELHTPTMIDNLIANREIQPVITVFLTIGISREADYMGYDDSIRFLSEHVLNHISNKYNGSKLPSQIFVGGFSRGGFAATQLGLKRPDLFGKIMRGDTMINEVFPDQLKTKAPAGYPEIDELKTLIKKYGKNIKLPNSKQKFYISVSNTKDPDVELPKGQQWVSIITHKNSNKSFSSSLEKLGIHVTFREMNMGHNQLHMQVLLHDALLKFFPFE